MKDVHTEQAKLWEEERAALQQRADLLESKLQAALGIGRTIIEEVQGKGDKRRRTRSMQPDPTSTIGLSELADTIGRIVKPLQL